VEGAVEPEACCSGWGSSSSTSSSVSAALGSTSSTVDFLESRGPPELAGGALPSINVLLLLLLAPLNINGGPRLTKSGAAARVTVLAIE